MVSQTMGMDLCATATHAHYPTAQVCMLHMLLVDARRSVPLTFRGFAGTGSPSTKPTTLMIFPKYATFCSLSCVTKDSNRQTSCMFQPFMSSTATWIKHLLELAPSSSRSPEWPWRPTPPLSKALLQNPCLLVPELAQSQKACQHHTQLPDLL